MKKFFLILVIPLLFSGCVYDQVEQPAAIPITTPGTTPVLMPTENTSSKIPVINPEENVSELNESSHKNLYTNKSEAIEVNYREYVDWFKNHNINIRAYTPLEYVCGQYTVDMINDSRDAGFSAYFASVMFTDGSGHALVSFKSTVSGVGTSWYFFEPQTNNLMTPETIERALNRAMGKKVNEVSIYGYYDDGGDTDPTSWRFAYPLYSRKY